VRSNAAEPWLGLRRIEDMPEKIVYVESMEDTLAALRDRGLDASDARRLVHEAFAAADGEGFRVRARRPQLGDIYGLYVLAGAVAAVTAFLTALH
jgi:hypothetical protein